MTDAASKIDDEPVPEMIATHYLSSVDDVVEHLRAAATLGFGVRLLSYLKSDADGGGGYVEGWELELLSESPVREEEDESEDEDEDEDEE